MPKFDKPANLNTIWASEALSQNNVYPSVSYAEEGWLQVKPPYQYENALNFKHDQMLAHLNQLGIPEWDSTTEYQAGKSYVQGSNNVVYKCIQTHINKNPATAGNEAFWNVWEGNRQATQTARGTVELATDNETRQGTSSILAVTPQSLLNSLPNGTFDTVSNSTFTLQNIEGGVKKSLVLKSGSVSMTSSTQTVNFSSQFPSACLGVIITSISSLGDTAEYVQITSFTRGSFNCVGYNIPVNANNPTSDTQNFTYLAIGY